MGPLFQDRSDAGRFLAGKLMHHANDPSLLVLGLPRGGVPVAFEVANELNACLDVFVIRRLGVPGYEDLSMGAIASGGMRVLNEELVQRLSIPEPVIEAVTREEEQELIRSETAFRGGRQPAGIHGRTVILVDDGLATGAAMRAAVRALRSQRPSYLSVAVPIGSRDTCDHFRAETDELVCGDAPEPFFAVGTWYSNFMPVTDDEVCRLLDHAAHQRRARRIQEQKSQAA